MFLHADLHAVRAHQWLRRAATRPRQPRTTATHDDRGQATAEYGLVILAAGGIALGVIAWAAKTGTFTELFETVVDKLSDGL
jgi:hypothetical protein